MTHTSFSVAMSSEAHARAESCLLRSDGQEDVCFALWRPSEGISRLSGLVREVILPEPGDRMVHGNASFLPQYFQRALGLAIAADAGLALLHSHPGGREWQGMSPDDVRAEQGHAAATKAATALPLLGLTLAGDRSWSARLWEKIQPRVFEPQWCSNVRVVGNQFAVTFNDALVPRPRFREQLRRTVSAWGEPLQATLARFHVGVVGTGSVGALVAETLARTGVSHITLLDFDSVETVNLDRLLHATDRDAARHRSKVNMLAEALRSGATAEHLRVDTYEFSIGEERGFRAALDCDLLFSCVDRPWGRSVLNFIAYAHLIPVVDGGIAVETTPNGRLRGADWRAHVAAPGRRCLACLGQYDPGLVAAEREGYFDDPRYIAGLAEDHPIRRNENVFAFSLGAASLQVLQALSMIIAPLGIWDPGEQMYHFATGRLDAETPRPCLRSCAYPHLIGLGDRTGYTVTAQHQKAEDARAARAQRCPQSDPGDLTTRVLRRIGWPAIRSMVRAVMSRLTSGRSESPKE